PEEYAMPPEIINPAIERAVADAAKEGISGKRLTPYLLARIVELTGGDSLESNIALVKNNATLAAEIAVAYASL
ncbi:MAG TPA: pseudouridine-5'-phosphate glycosidase, partial [Rectinemataceae bacterium]|nr:pseudouridine-5'-phosphate glycosidase [Rectinemataceae bacterium]